MGFGITSRTMDLKRLSMHSNAPPLPLEVFANAIHTFLGPRALCTPSSSSLGLLTPKVKSRKNPIHSPYTALQPDVHSCPDQDMKFASSWKTQMPRNFFDAEIVHTPDLMQMRVFLDHDCRGPVSVCELGET